MRLIAQIFRHTVLRHLLRGLAALDARLSGRTSLRVPGASMEPTLKTNELAHIDEKACNTLPPARGDVVAYRSHKHNGVLLPTRIVALAGDAVALRDGTLYVNDLPVQEPYVQPGRAEQDHSRNTPRVVVPTGFFFGLGDFRDHSEDSRTVGPLEVRTIVGRIVAAKPLMAGSVLRAIR